MIATLAVFALLQGAPPPADAKPAEAKAAPAAPAPAPGSALASGLRAYHLGHFKAAEDAFRQAVDADPKSAAAHYYLGYAIYKQAEPKRPDDPGKAKAAEEFAAAFKLDPTFKPTFR